MLLALGEKLATTWHWHLFTEFGHRVNKTTSLNLKKKTEQKILYEALAEKV